MRVIYIPHFRNATTRPFAITSSQWQRLSMQSSRASIPGRVDTNTGACSARQRQSQTAGRIIKINIRRNCGRQFMIVANGKAVATSPTRKARYEYKCQQCKTRVKLTVCDKELVSTAAAIGDCRCPLVHPTVASHCWHRYSHLLVSCAGVAPATTPAPIVNAAVPRF